MTYTVKKQYRNIENGKPKGGWIYHELFKTNNQTESFDYIKTCPADQKWEFYIIQQTRPS